MSEQPDLDAAVEAGARALAVQRGWCTEKEWDEEVDVKESRRWDEQARAVLEAALPHLPRLPAEPSVGAVNAAERELEGWREFDIGTRAKVLHALHAAYATDLSPSPDVGRSR